ncbi:hypothetical protein [Paraflavitalea sp. CAU 1676]|uniref:hypothetical protein n=1 Tax=Paraflavitalea sp. CAU 1676 TaxID=3032598 RepID=UPI0023DC04EE|nr:hypothetical protein [Paraflavitalea sp. CAU 1676]MDF2187219.1 hypothetical protein [Paraflavitalea sp. CAU 1676]
MEHSVNILNELEAISPAVARVGRVMPYTVPDGYFSGLPEAVMRRIRVGEEVLPAVLRAAGTNPYTVPAGYFEFFPAQVLQVLAAGAASTRAGAQQDTDSTLPAAVGANPYTVPTGYFDQLADTILRRAKASDASLSAAEELSELSPLLSGLGKKMPFETPAGYFDGLTENVVSGAKAIDFVNEELENLPALLAGLKDKQVYEVPAGYFEQLPDQVLARVKTSAKPAKVISFGTGKRIMHYAAAAVVAGLVAFGAWWFTGPSGNRQEEQMAKKVNKIPEEELQSYIDNQSVAMPSSDLLATNNRPDLDAGDMSDLLQNVSDEEIQKYLDQNLVIQQTATN